MFDNTVTGFIQNIRFVPAYLESLERVLLDKYREREREITRQSSDMSRNIADLKNEKATVLDALIATKNPSIRADIEARIEGIEERIKETEEERGRLDIKEDDIKSFVTQAKYLMEHLEELLINQLNMHAQRALFGLVFEGLPTYPDLLNGTPKLSLVFQLSSDFQNGNSHTVDCRGFGWNTLETMILKWKAVFQTVSLPDYSKKAA